MLCFVLAFVEFVRLVDRFSAILGFVVAGMGSCTHFFRRMNSDLAD